jgi:hypothetical protein
MTTNDKADSSNGDAGNAAAKTETTAPAKANARKKQPQHRNQKNASAAKKKTQPHVTKSTFEGIASGVNPMKNIVIAQGNGNLSEQFRVYQNKMAGSAADDKAYGLDSAILELTPKVRSDFVKPKPNPNVHSTLTPVIENGTATGGNKLVCFDPALKEQMDAEYSMDLKIQSSNWNQYQRHEEGFYRTAIGNVENEVLTYCRRDARMALVESNKDLVGFLLILRSICAQNKGSVKVDEEYQNLITLHQALSFRQNKKTNNTTFGENVLSRYESAIFTCGKFAFGQSTYDTVLNNYSTPMTFAEYMLLPANDQIPIDDIVKERIVARLIIKNSLNEQLKEYLVKTFSVNNNTCYPNNRSDAVSLLSTFANVRNTNDSTSNADEAVVSYHEAEDIITDQDDSIMEEGDVLEHTNDGIDDGIDITKNEDDMVKHVTFDASVMAAVIAEASAESEEDQFLGATFAQMQEVDDVYEDNEPDLVCYAHIIDNNIVDDNPPIVRAPPVDNIYHNTDRDFDLIMYHTSQRVNNRGNVHVIHYDRERPDLISHEYDSPCAESIVDYADAMRLKLKLAGIHDSSDLMTIFEDRTDVEAAVVLKAQLNDVEQRGLKTSTVRLLKEETFRHKSHAIHNSIRYDQMIDEIGVDDAIETFPTANILLHHVVSAVSINQHRHKPNRWVNKVTLKLINCGITTIDQLELKLRSNTLNDHIHEHNLPRLHQVTIHGFELILGMADFHRGRS